MRILFTLLGIAASVGGIVCAVIILIDAFRNAVWKGLACIICGCYGLYFMFVEFEHKDKWLIVIGALISGSVAGAMYRLAM